MCRRSRSSFLPRRLSWCCRAGCLRVCRRRGGLRRARGRWRPGRLPGGLPAEGRAALAAALAGEVPGGQQDRGELVRAAGQACWDEGECARLRGFLDAVDDPRGRQGREYPLGYLLALPLVAGMAGDDELDAAGEWAASAPEEVLLKLG